MQGIGLIKMRSIARITADNMNLKSEDAGKFYYRLNNFITNKAESISKEEWAEIRSTLRQINESISADIKELDSRIKKQK